MTTDRVNGYAIDTGVTLLGNRYRAMRALVRRLALPAAPVPFSLAIRDDGGCRRYRAQRALDVLLGSGLSVPAKWAAIRVLAGILLSGRGMLHGNSERVMALDRETVAEYFARLGRGGQELLAKVFEPGLRAALGGALAGSSRFRSHAGDLEHAGCRLLEHRWGSRPLAGSARERTSHRARDSCPRGQGCVVRR